MNFGKWIVVAFVLFAGFIGTLVTVCVRQDIPLVSKEYYQDELVYQDQIDRMENANMLDDKPEITLDAQAITVVYDRFAEVQHGKLKLFRPSDSELDETFELSASTANSQVFQIKNPAPGLYRARLSWEQEGKEYYIEKILVL